MLAKRIIPCLDVKDGKTVKGTKFVDFKEAGDPVLLGEIYSKEGADELVYLDITASSEGRSTFTDLVKRVASRIDIPFTVGGGINSLQDIDRLLNVGADKVSLNSSALKNPKIIDDVAKKFGSQVCVIAIDANFENGNWVCYLNGGKGGDCWRPLCQASESKDKFGVELSLGTCLHKQYPNTPNSYLQHQYISLCSCLF